MWLVDTEKLHFKVSLVLMHLDSHMWLVFPGFDSLVQTKRQLVIIVLLLLLSPFHQGEQRLKELLQGLD